MFYNKYITNLVLNLGGHTTKVIDKGSVELIGPWGLEKALVSLSKDLSRLSTSMVTSYALYILIGFVFYIWVTYTIVYAYSSLLVLLLIAVFATFSMERDNCNLHRRVGKLTLKSSPSHLKSKRYYSSDARIVKDLGDNTEKLKPEWVTGFTDAEGCFGVVVVKNPELRLGWEIRLTFSISLHKKDLALLKMIQAFFEGHGRISENHGKSSVQYVVTGIDTLTVIVSHFDQYPLVSKKLADYLLFNKIFKLCLQKAHLTSKGVQEILSLKANLNLGVNLELKESFPDLVPVPRPLIEKPLNLNGDWVAGFVSGDGGFSVNITQPISGKQPYIVSLEFRVTQNERDKELLNSLISFFGCGKVTKKGGKYPAWEYRCRVFKDINQIIRVFFQTHKILGLKSLDYQDWSRAAEIIENKGHLTPEGLAQLKEIKSGMNSARPYLYDKSVERPTKTLESGFNSLTWVAGASFVIGGTLVNTLSLDLYGILLNYTEYLPVINDTASITNHTILLPNDLSNFPKRGSVLGGDIIQHFFRPTIKTTHSLTNSLPNSFNPTIEPSILNSMYQFVMSNRNLAITFILGSFGALAAWCVGIISNGLNVFISNIFWSIKKFAGKIRNCMNYGYSTTQAQGSGSYISTGSDTDGGNEGNIPNFSNIGGYSSGSGGGDDRNNNNKLPREPEDMLTNLNSFVIYLMDLFSFIDSMLSNILAGMRINLASLERAAYEENNSLPLTLGTYSDQWISIEILETTLNNLRIFDYLLSISTSNNRQVIRNNIAHIVREIELFFEYGWIIIDGRRVINFAYNSQNINGRIEEQRNFVNSVERLIGSLDRRVLIGDLFKNPTKKK
jgi:hypothetical protein